MRPLLNLSWFSLLACLSTGLTHCVSSIEPDVTVASAPAEDLPYQRSLTAATIERTIFKDFEMRVIVSATYLSPEFRRAFEQRLDLIYGKHDIEFKEATDKAGFFITLDAPTTDERTDLNNPLHWNIVMETAGGQIKPVLIKRIVDKERWRAFFPSVNSWTSEYIAVFDVPSVDPKSSKMVVNTPVRLKLANADAQLHFAW